MVSLVVQVERRGRRGGLNDRFRGSDAAGEGRSNSPRGMPTSERARSAQRGKVRHSGQDDVHGRHCQDDDDVSESRLVIGRDETGVGRGGSVPLPRGDGDSGPIEIDHARDFWHTFPF